MQQHEVDAAADALIALRLRPTVERVRQHIGRGSPNTVAPMLETWFGTLAPRLGIPTQDGEADTGRRAPASVRQAMEQVWATALASAQDQATAALAGERERLARERAELETSRAALASQEAAAAQREQLLRDARDLAQRQLTEATQQVRDLQTTLQRRDQDLADVRSSLAALVQQKDAAVREHDRQLAASNQERERLQERFAASERRLLEEVDRARQETKVAEKTSATFQQRAAAERVEHAQAAQAQDEQLRQLQLDHAALAERLAASERRAAEYQGLLSLAAAKPAAAAPAARRSVRGAAGGTAAIPAAAPARRPRRP